MEEIRKQADPYLGMGDTHLDVNRAFGQKFGVEVNLTPPKIPIKPFAGHPKRVI